MIQTTFSICEECLEKMYKSFKIPPQQFDLDGCIEEEEEEEEIKEEDETA